MNYIKLTVAILAIALMSNNVNANDCFGGTNCGPWSTNSMSKTFTPEDYPGCEVTVHYITRLCDGEIQIDFIGMSYSGDTPSPCDDLTYALTGGQGLGAYPDPFLLAELYTEGYDKTAHSIFQDFYNDAPNSLDYDQEDMECPNKYTLKTSFNAPCITFAYAYKYIGPYGDYMVEIKSASCDESACCNVEYEMCYDTNTQTIISTRTTSSDPSGDCAGQTPPVIVFPELDETWTIVQGPCTDACLLQFYGD